MTSFPNLNSLLKKLRNPRQIEEKTIQTKVHFWLKVPKIQNYHNKGRITKKQINNYIRNEWWNVKIKEIKTTTLAATAKSIRIKAKKLWMKLMLWTRNLERLIMLLFLVAISIKIHHYYRFQNRLLLKIKKRL